MQNQIQMIGITPADLISELKSALIPELKSALSSEFQPKQPDEYITRNEAAKIFKKNLSTIHRWSKTGKLRPIFLEGSVYFRRSDIEALMVQNQMK